MASSANSAENTTESIVENVAENTTEDNTEEVAENNMEEEENTMDKDSYFGIFISSARLKNKHTDKEGFANWGNPNSSTDYNSSGNNFGILIGKKVQINNIPFRLELDATLGKISASTKQVDPKGLDETAKSETIWLVTAQAGPEKEFGTTTLFVKGGLALGLIRNSVTDLDYQKDGTQALDPDDSFKDDSIHVGWIISIGAEFPLTNTSKKYLRDESIWRARIEGFHADFGEENYQVNHSGNNRCGVGGAYKPCNYSIKNEVNGIRLVFVRNY